MELLPPCLSVRVPCLFFASFSKPTQNIRLLRLNSEGATTVEQIITNDDAEIESFLNDLARELGITNFSLFYEKCFILVEGATEENALPVLYKRIYRSSLLEDGIQIQNLNGIGAAKQFLKLLSHNRQLPVLSSEQYPFRELEFSYLFMLIPNLTILHKIPSLI